MLDVMFDVPSSDIIGIKLTRQVVLGQAKPVLRRKSDKAAA
jgi:ATP-dependent protease Clp ATPase subunit